MKVKELLDILERLTNGEKIQKNIFIKPSSGVGDRVITSIKTDLSRVILTRIGSANSDLKVIDIIARLKTHSHKKVYFQLETVVLKYEPTEIKEFNKGLSLGRY